MRALFLVSLITLTGCASTAVAQQKSSALQKFAYANCLMWYFDARGHDTRDIRAISGGIVETSDISLETFQQVALLVKQYQPNLKSKQNIDVKLQRCFHLDENEQLMRLVNGK